MQDGGDCESGWNASSPRDRIVAGAAWPRPSVLSPMRPTLASRVAFAVVFEIHNYVQGLSV